jgi:hypothetical protein
VESKFLSFHSLGVDLEVTMGTRSLTIAQLLKPYEQVNLHNSAKLANTDILDVNLTPIKTPCLFRIHICSDTAAIFSAMITSGGNTQTVGLNGNANLTANALHREDLLVHLGDSINFQFNGAVTIKIFRIQEITAGVQ